MSGASEITLSVEDLKTYFFLKEGVAKAVDGVSFQIAKGEILGIVGESGSGKSVTAFSIMGLVDPPGQVVGGRIKFHGRDLTTLSDREARKLRGDRISIIFQDANVALNPVLRIDTQMIEAVLAHRNVTRREAREIAIKGLRMVGIPAPEARINSYPHEFSGGMRQRLSIAIALLNEPDLILADEPTTALDVTVQAQILCETQKLCRERGTSLIWVTHDLTVVAGLVDHVCVMYAGKIVETGPVDDLLDNPQHPYTIGLIGSIPSANTRNRKLYQIPGMAPQLLALDEGCAFRARCAFASQACERPPPEVTLGPRRSVFCVHPQGASLAPLHGKTAR